MVRTQSLLIASALVLAEVHVALFVVATMPLVRILYTVSARVTATPSNTAVFAMSLVGATA